MSELLFKSFPLVNADLNNILVEIITVFFSIDIPSVVVRLHMYVNFFIPHSSSVSFLTFGLILYSLSY